MAYKPRIGITMRLELETRRFYLGRDYSEALEASGAVPVHIALIPKREYIVEAMKGLDGILLPGSNSDVDPAYYGEDPHPKLGQVIPEKDETDLLVLEEVERQNLPLFAICFGMQSLNISRGGSLYQDIGSQIENPIKHEQGIPIGRNSHKIKVAENSLLGSVNGDAQAKVNSSHHQAIKNVGKNLEAIAWANDGVIEGIQDTRKDRFVLGVQWHPELSWSFDKFSRGIFDLFVSRCSRQFSGERQFAAFAEQS